MQSAATTAAPQRVSLGLKLGYSVGFIASATWGVLAGIALFFYNQVLGVPAHLVSLALGLILFIDALWDPLIGEWSDRTRSKMGRRHPFLYAAMLLAPIALVIRWHPPADWSDMSLFYFILATGLFMSFTSSLFDVPAAALAPELAPDYHDRTSLMGFRFLFAMLGTALTSVLVYGVFLRATPEHPVGQLNPDGYGSLAIAVAALAIVAMATLTLCTRRTAATLYQAPPQTSSLAQQIRDVIATLSTRDFAVAAAAAALVGISGGVTAGLQLYMTTYFWELSSGDILILTLSAIAGAPISFVVAPMLGRRFGKRNSCMAALFGGLILTGGPMILRLFGVLPDNDSPLLLPILFSTYVLAAILGISGNILTSSMVQDLVEDSQAKTGRRSEGLIISADTLPQKILSSFSVIVPGILLAWVGFPQGAQPGEVDPEIIRKLAIFYLSITWVITLASIATWSLFRIDEQRHASNLAKIG